MSANKRSYKYCLVPKCGNTTTKTPNKIFFSVPRNETLRKKWCRIMKRHNRVPLSNTSCLHCCEDHFNVEQDMANYVKYKLVGGIIKLKKGVVPHKFDCQEETKETITKTAKVKRLKIKCHEKVLSKDISAISTGKVVLIDHGNKKDISKNILDDMSDISQEDCKNINKISKSQKSIEVDCNIQGTKAKTNDTGQANKHSTGEPALQADLLLNSRSTSSNNSSVQATNFHLQSSEESVNPYQMGICIWAKRIFDFTEVTIKSEPEFEEHDNTEYVKTEPILDFEVGFEGIACNNVGIKQEAVEMGGDIHRREIDVCLNNVNTDSIKVKCEEFNDSVQSTEHIPLNKKKKSTNEQSNNSYSDRYSNKGHESTENREFVNEPGLKSCIDLKDEPSTFQSNKSDKVIQTKSRPERNLRSHHKNKQCECEFYPKKFHRVAILKQNIRVHTGERPFDCKYCQKDFT